MKNGDPNPIAICYSRKSIVFNFTGFGYSERMEMDQSGVEEIKKDILKLLGKENLHTIQN